MPIHSSWSYDCIADRGRTLNNNYPISSMLQVKQRHTKISARRTWKSRYYYLYSPLWYMLGLIVSKLSKDIINRESEASSRQLRNVPKYQSTNAAKWWAEYATPKHATNVIKCCIASLVEFYPTACRNIAKWWRRSNRAVRWIIFLKNDSRDAVAPF